ncbi:hypothetical protein B0T21DRAFT_359130 [Apiosordaria backusii]|uniref:PH domain-containing protein n=1 Tax=Apiosordaria backusii TaxID=314023 RepID=A0AA40K4B0_9PEZI|nr:hypothetical protein B0T21DRAFT_359130 [Apiosordaria backusii]
MSGQQEDSVSSAAGLEALQFQNSLGRRSRPPPLGDVNGEAEKVPLRVDDKLRRRESRLGLRSIFGRNKSTSEADKAGPASPREAPQRSGGIRASLTGISNWPYQFHHTGQRSESALSFTKSGQAGQNLKHKKSTSAVRGGQAPSEGIASWSPPPLFQAYPQAIKHAHLPACTASTESVLRLNHKTSFSIGGNSNPATPIVENFDEAVAEKGEKPKKRHRRNTSGLGGKFEWTTKIFVLVTAGYLLQYSGEGSYDRLPEKILHLGKDSAAFASDAIPGRHWVLQISAVAESDRVPSSHGSSLLARLPFLGPERGRSSTFLMVFESAEEMDSWIAVLRREIEALGGRKVLSETGKPKTAEEDLQLKSQTSQRTLIVRDPERFSRIWDHSPLTNPDIYLDLADEDAIREQSFDDTSSASVISHDGRQLDALRDSTNRFSYVSSGQRTMITSAGSSPACSPVRDTFAENESITPDMPPLDEHRQPKMRPNAAAINDRRQSLQAANHMLDMQLATAQTLRPRSTEMVPPFSLGSHPPPNFSIPQGISKRYPLRGLESTLGSASTLPSRMGSRRPPPSALSINPRPLSLVLDQPSPASSPLSHARKNSESAQSALSSNPDTLSASPPSHLWIESDKSDEELSSPTQPSYPAAGNDTVKLKLNPPPRPRRPSACSDILEDESSLISPRSAIPLHLREGPRSSSSLGTYGGSHQLGRLSETPEPRVRRSSFSAQPGTSLPLSPRYLSQRPLKSMARSSQHLRIDSLISPQFLSQRRSMSQLAEGPPPGPPPTRALPPIPKKSSTGSRASLVSSPPPPGFI